mgnify:CR=1 FL=1
MKSINLWTALILCSLFVFSCTNLRIEKRRYNKGLHIHSSSKSRTASSPSTTVLEKNRAESQPKPSSYNTVSSFDKKTDAPKSSSKASIDGLHSKAVTVVQMDNMKPKKDVTTPRKEQNSMKRTERINNAKPVHESKNVSKQVSKVSTVKPTHTVGSIILSVFGWIFLSFGTLVLIWAAIFFGWFGIFGILIALGILLLGVILVVIGARIKGNNDKSDAKASSIN